MKIGIIGAGFMAEALGARWADAGHELLVGSSDLGKAAVVAARIGAEAQSGSRRDAAKFGDVVLVAVRYEAVPGALADVGAPDGALAGRVVIDCTNPVEDGTGRLVAVGAPSMAERVAELTQARVVKGFNLCPSDVWRAPVALTGQPLAVPLCGDDGTAVAAVGRLVTDMGCIPVVMGGLDRSGQLEAVAGFIIGLAFAGIDPRMTFARGPADTITS